MMAAKQISYASIFGAYVMRTQYELVKNKASNDTCQETNEAVVQETVEDYIEQA